MGGSFLRTAVRTEIARLRELLANGEAVTKEWTT